MWFIRSDLCGLFSAGFTVLLLLYAQLVLVTVVILPWYGFSLHVPVYTALTLLALVSHSRAQFTDPGAVPRDRLPPPPSVVSADANGQKSLPPPPRVCRRCKTLKPYHAHHCSTCGRCMIRMDHHCPWVNNCVALFNQKYFLLFLLYTSLCCLYCGVLLVARFVSCTNNLRTCSISGVQAVLCVLNFIEAIIFGLFCIIMMWDQLSAIFDNTPGIDALQNKHGASRGKYESLQSVFGEPLNWRWWLPLRLPARMRAEFALELEQMDDPYEMEVQSAQQELEQAQQQAQQQAAFQREMERMHAGSGGHAHEQPHGHGDALQQAVVFPDAYQPLERDSELDPVLASLQSPPHSPLIQGLAPRHAHARAHASDTKLE